MEGLGRQLLDQARYGAWLLNGAREKLIVAQLLDLQKNINSDPNLENKNARVVDLEVGYTRNNSGSNVYDDFADELQDFDLQADNSTKLAPYAADVLVQAAALTNGGQPVP